MKTIVIYYSHKGNNKYLANKIADRLQCDREELRPRLKGFLFIMLALHAGIKPVKAQLDNYERIILVGPIYVGRLIYPLQSFIKTHRQRNVQWYFATCCGSNFQQKEDKFGHARLFEKVRALLGHKCKDCQAFPIDLALPEDQQKESGTAVQTRLSEENFQGNMSQLFEEYTSRLQSM
jgi:menaquinone-dependent protoporphyrinogen IX oxidase